MSSSLRRRGQAEPNHPGHPLPGREEPVQSGVETFQNHWELGVLDGIVERLTPTAILEVGAMYGGTLWYWLRIADRVTVVDDEMREAQRWEEWAEMFETELDLLHGQSQDPELIAKAAELGPYDFAFIDADHSEAAVRADYDNLGTLGRVIGLHDILPRPGYGVSVVWEELKSEPGARWVEVCDRQTLPGNEGPCGVGVLWT